MTKAMISTDSSGTFSPLLTQLVANGSCEKSVNTTTARLRPKRSLRFLRPSFLHSTRSVMNASRPPSATIILTRTIVCAVSMSYSLCSDSSVDSTMKRLTPNTCATMLVTAPSAIVIGLSAASLLKLINSNTSLLHMSMAGRWSIRSFRSSISVSHRTPSNPSSHSHTK